MSEGMHNLGDEQAVLGEPASHPHQAVVVGEPPESVDPVLGEPAFANGLQDQQSIPPSSTEETSAANGVQSVSHVPLHEEGLASLEPSSHSSTPDEESPNLHHVPPTAEARESGIGEADSYQSEPPAAENPGLSASLVDEAPGESDAHIVRSTDIEPTVNANAHDAAGSAVEEPAADVEILHIVESPSEAPPSLSEALTDNPFAALDEDQEGSAFEPGEISTGDAASSDGPPASNATSAPDEISSEGLDNQQEEASALQGKQPVENSSSIQTDADDRPLDGSKAAVENVGVAEVGEGGHRTVEGQGLDSKEANLEKDDTGSAAVEHALPQELDQGIERDGHGVSDDGVPESEFTDRDAGHSSSKEACQSEAPTVEPSTHDKDKVNENHATPTISESQSKEEEYFQSPLVESAVAPSGTRELSVEDPLVKQPPAVEASAPLEANGSNGYQLGEDGLVEREQDLSKVDDDTSADAEKPNFRSKLPLIFTGIAIAAVGVAVASISRPH